MFIRSSLKFVAEVGKQLCDLSEACTKCLGVDGADGNVERKHVPLHTRTKTMINMKET